MKDGHDNELPDVIEPAARWSDDCQGKKDYDGWLVSISTRYWPGPGGGGTMIVSNGPEGVTVGTLPYGSRPSARASINLLFGEPDESGYNSDYFMLVEEEFVGDTEADVKRQVEAWVKARANDVKLALVKLFRS